MELTFVVAVKDIWQLQTFQKFTRNRKMVGGWGLLHSPPPHTHTREFLFFTLEMLRQFKIKAAKRRILTLFEAMFLEVATVEKSLKSRTLNGAFIRYLRRCFGSWDCGEPFENKDASCAF